MVMATVVPVVARVRAVTGHVRVDNHPVMSVVIPVVIPMVVTVVLIMVSSMIGVMAGMAHAHSSVQR